MGYGMTWSSKEKGFQQVKLYKLTKNRIAFSLYKYFIKVILTKNISEAGPQPLNDEFDRLFYTENVAHSPMVLYSKCFTFFKIEISQNIKNAKSLSNEKQKELFYDKVSGAISSMSEDVEKISWKEILLPQTLVAIRNNKKIFEYIQYNLSDKLYPKTGMHGDLNPNNILFDQSDRFWIVDWENSTCNGSALWDLYWLYGIWKRDTSKVPSDIISIFNNSQKADTKTRNILLIYALMKLRLDLMQHKKSTDVSLENFFLRVSYVMTIF